MTTYLTPISTFFWLVIFYRLGLREVKIPANIYECRTDPGNHIHYKEFFWR